jgi:hypothetical protein
MPEKPLAVAGGKVARTVLGVGEVADDRAIRGHGARIQPPDIRSRHVGPAGVRAADLVRNAVIPRAFRGDTGEHHAAVAGPQFRVEDGPRVARDDQRGREAESTFDEGHRRRRIAVAAFRNDRGSAGTRVIQHDRLPGSGRLKPSHGEIVALLKQSFQVLKSRIIVSAAQQVDRVGGPVERG